jgi:hypothetical protein
MVAPVMAYGIAAEDELFSARIGCETYGVFGADLGVPCSRKRS